VILEEQGIPTVVIVTTPFITSGKAMAVSQGIPDYPFVAIPHPIAATEEFVLNQRVDDVMNEIEKILLTDVKEC